MSLSYTFKRGDGFDLLSAKVGDHVRLPVNSDSFRAQSSIGHIVYREEKDGETLLLFKPGAITYKDGLIGLRLSSISCGILTDGPSTAVSPNAGVLYRELIKRYQLSLQDPPLTDDSADPYETEEEEAAADTERDPSAHTLREE